MITRNLPMYSCLLSTTLCVPEIERCRCFRATGGLGASSAAYSLRAAISNRNRKIHRRIPEASQNLHIRQATAEAIHHGVQAIEKHLGFLTVQRPATRH